MIFIFLIWIEFTKIIYFYLFINLYYKSLWWVATVAEEEGACSLVKTTRVQTQNFLKIYIKDAAMHEKPSNPRLSGIDDLIRLICFDSN